MKLQFIFLALYILNWNKQFMIQKSMFEDWSICIGSRGVAVGGDGGHTSPALF